MEPPPRRRPALPEEIAEEILVRFPPDDPASLVRAVLVCKPWCRLVSGAGFRRRFRQFHRTPPVLGFVCHLKDGGDSVSRFVPTSSFQPSQAVHLDWRVLDARHGRVLHHNMDWGVGWGPPKRLAVWDPVTDARREIPPSPLPTCTAWIATVLCADTDACDHLDCHRGHFLVVLLADGVVLTGGLRKLALCVYSSKTGAWSQPTCLASARQYAIDNRSVVALVGNTLYFGMDSNSLLKYDLATQEFCVILQPPGLHKLVTMEDGGLGIAKVDEAARLFLWSMETKPNGDIGWAQTRVIDLKKLLPANVSSIFTLCAGVLLVGTADGLFCFHLKSDRVRKLCEETWHVCSIELIVPYISFFTPAVVSTGEGPRMGA